MLGIGLVLGNWVGLTALVVLPFLGILYRIHVEESVLLGYFGSAYQEYANRTKRLLPRILVGKKTAQRSRAWAGRHSLAPHCVGCSAGVFA